MFLTGTKQKKRHPVKVGMAFAWHNLVYQRLSNGTKPFETAVFAFTIFKIYNRFFIVCQSENALIRYLKTHKI